MVDLVVKGLQRGRARHDGDQRGTQFAFGNDARILALDVPERETIMWALDDPPSKALAELRGVLLEEHVGRVQHGLV